MPVPFTLLHPVPRVVLVTGLRLYVAGYIRIGKLTNDNLTSVANAAISGLLLRRTALSSTSLLVWPNRVEDSPSHGSRDARRHLNGSVMKFSSPKTVRIPSMKLVIGRSAQMSLELLLREGAGGENLNTSRSSPEPRALGNPPAARCRPGHHILAAPPWMTESRPVYK